MQGEVECDEVFNIACAAYNFFPNGQSHESYFSLCFKEMCTYTLAKLLQPKIMIFRRHIFFTTDRDVKRNLYVSSNKSKKKQEIDNQLRKLKTSQNPSSEILYF